MTVRCTKISMKRNFILLLLCFVASIGHSEEFYYEVPATRPTTSTNTSKGVEVAFGDYKWTITSNIDYLGYNLANIGSGETASKLYYLTFCTASNPASWVTLSTDGIKGDVESVEIRAWSSKVTDTVYPSLSVTVGDTSYGSQTIEYTSSGGGKFYKFTKPNNANGSGKIVIKYAQECKAALYFASLKITYNHTSVTLSQDSDNTTIISDNNGKTVDVHLDRKFTADGGWYTLCLPFAVSNDQLATVFGDGVRVESLTAARKETDGTTTLVFSAVSNGVEAGKAYLVKPTETAENPVFSGVTLSSATPQPTEVGGYTFVGTYGLTHLDPTNANYRLLGGNDGLGLYRIAADDATNLKGTRGYFVFPSDSQQAAEAKVAVSVPTDIHSVIGVEKVKDGIYTLQGVKIEHADHLPAGVYINNGKKILVK